MLNEIDDFSDSDLFVCFGYGFTEDAARIIQIAALCSKAVYRKDPGQVVPQLRDYAIKDRHWIEPTMNGSGKAAALFEILPTDPSSQRRALVVAVRGSASSIDWLVNLNSDLAECPDLVKLPESRLKPMPKVHRGFADCARTIAPGLVNQIKAALDEDQMQDQEIEIVFTGHSAGGAVACLLFCYLLTSKVLDLPSKKPTLSCVTFGCPPLFNTDIDARLTKLYGGSNFLPGNMLAFPNDGDPVPRMDAAYATELARIWYLVGGGKCPPATEFENFKPPKLRLNGLGQLVVLFEKEQEGDEDDDDDRDGDEEEEEDEEEEIIMACRLSHGDLEHQAWANVAAHRMNKNVKWITRIGDGSFNGRKAWAD
ncbi:hypothetical protein CSIM01_08953 [Colletotrichum simmondsii]|uniref:Fungal lipase-type domain-containing protein n=1 Tax=Colletotrichum simmondsii TaxID=703756 RepID=A0A135SHK2_9PEZI|nr:hypothetical protein CSIM01_08953 [Colletotrichum simmondsii]